MSQQNLSFKSEKTNIIMFCCCLIFLLVCFSVGLLINKNKFSEVNKEILITSPAKSKIYLSNPCKSSIYGDPVDVGNDYVKINIHCGTETSANTLALRALKTQTSRGLIEELGRVLGFEVVISGQEVIQLGDLENTKEKGWSCSIYKQKITDLDQKLELGQLIDCSY